MRDTSGAGVDAQGRPVIDPTENVLALVKAANQRQDDLRQAAAKLAHTKNDFQRELSDLRAQHQRELAHAESQRLDSIRQIDREDVNKTAAQALNAIQTLATTTNTTAETLRTQVATTAQAAATQLATITGEINKRLSALELASSEGKGKQAFSDPMMEKIVSRMDTLLQNGATFSGQREGISVTVAVLLGAIALLGTLVGIAAGLYALLKP